MPRRPHLIRLRRPLSLLAAGVVLSVAGCGGGAVEVEEYDVSDEPACKKLVADLPAKVADQPARDVEGSPFAQAYGDPAIVVRCGVALPKDWKFAWCQTANGIDWYIADENEVFEDQSRDVVMVLLHRTPSIEVTLPAAYRPPSTAMIDLERTIRAHTDKTGACTTSATP